MNHNFINKIESASYLKKNTGLYIPFALQMDGTNCTYIKPMLSRSEQVISFINKDNKDYSCRFNYLECKDDYWIYISDDFQKYLIDKNDPQLDEHGKIVNLLTNNTFKD